MKIQVNIGARIKNLREKKKLTQLQLAQKSKVDRTFIIHVEMGRRNLSVVSLDKIIKGLGTNFYIFFKKEHFNGSPPVNSKHLK